MLVFIFKILPILTILSLVVGVIFISLGISRGKMKQRLIGMASVALFVILLVVTVLLGLAQL